MPTKSRSRTTTEVPPGKGALAQDGFAGRRLPTHRPPTHPGEMLLEEFLKPLAISQARLADHLGVTAAHINEIVNGKRGITPATAWLLSEAFNTSPQLWLNLQNLHDLAHGKPRRRVASLLRTRAAG